MNAMPFVFKGNQETDPHLSPLSNFLERNFSNNENKVEMDEIDERLKVNILSILDTISDETVSGIIHALKYAGLESLSDLRFVQEEDLILVLKPIPRRKLINAWREQSKPPCPPLLPLPDVSAAFSNSSFPPLPLHNNHSSDSNVSSVHSFLPSVSFAAKALLTSTPTSLQNGLPLSNSSSPVKLKNLPLQKFKWKRKRKLALLRLYAQHKTELSNPDVEVHEVWLKIASEMGRIYNSHCDVRECIGMLEELRQDYELLKTKTILSKANTTLYREAQYAFETAENLESYLTNFRRDLLQVYAKYKSQLDCPDIEQQQVWEKIVGELKEQYSYNCGESLCQFELSELKSEYEGLKKDDTKKENVPYFEDARLAFENLELSNSEINGDSKTAGKYVPPHLRSEKR